VVFHAAGHRLIADIPLSATPKVITVSADSKRASLTSPVINQTLVVDLAKRQEIAKIRFGEVAGWNSPGKSLVLEKARLINA
jgi:hypothetical protein